MPHADIQNLDAFVQENPTNVFILEAPEKVEELLTEERKINQS